MQVEAVTFLATLSINQTSTGHSGTSSHFTRSAVLTLKLIPAQCDHQQASSR